MIVFLILLFWLASVHAYESQEAPLYITKKQAWEYYTNDPRNSGGLQAESERQSQLF